MRRCPAPPHRCMPPPEPSHCWVGTTLLLVLATVHAASLRRVHLAHRAPEIALRRALGATAGRMLRQRRVEGLGPVFLALALGLVAAVPLMAWFTAALPALPIPSATAGGPLYRAVAWAAAPTSPDPWLPTVAALALWLAAVLLCLLPALRGARVDPARLVR